MSRTKEITQEPAYVLRFGFSAVFGKRGLLLQAFTKWLHDVGVPALRLDLDRCVLALGYIGTSHSTASLDCNFDSLETAVAFLSRLHHHGDDLCADAQQREWVVDGSRRWELFRRLAGEPVQGGTGMIAQWSMTSSPGRVFDLVDHVVPAIGNIFSDMDLGGIRRRVLVGAVGPSEDAVTVEVDLPGMEQINALLAHMESGAAAAFIGAIAQEGFVVPGSQNWTVLRKVPA